MQVTLQDNNALPSFQPSPMNIPADCLMWSLLERRALDIQLLKVVACNKALLVLDHALGFKMWKG